MLEFILSKTVLIVLSLVVLIASGSVVSSFYSEQETHEAEFAFQQIASIARQADSFGSECAIRLEMGRYLGPESVLRIGNGSMVLLHGGRTYSADLEGSASMIRVLDDDRSEVSVMDVRQGDILVIERRWEYGALQTVIYIEKVDATLSTAFTNRSTSSTVL